MRNLYDKKTAISEEIKSTIIHRVEKFNTEYLSKESSKYVSKVQNNFVYLNRIDINGREEPICRVTYTGNLDEMSFAIFKYSSEKYAAKEIFFPGSEYVDGTLEGAMKAGLDAYPIETFQTPNTASNQCQCCKKLGMLDIVQELFEMDRKADARKAEKACEKQSIE